MGKRTPYGLQFWRHRPEAGLFDSTLYSAGLYSSRCPPTPREAPGPSPGCVHVCRRRGHTVGGLTRDDFIVEDGGKPRDHCLPSKAGTPGAASHPSGPSEPTAATSPTPTPSARYLGIVFDDLSMGPGDLIPARCAARKFLTQSVSPGHLVAVFVLSKGQTVPFTSDIAKLSDALDRLSIGNPQSRSSQLPQPPRL